MKQMKHIIEKINEAIASEKTSEENKKLLEQFRSKPEIFEKRLDSKDSTVFLISSGFKTP